MKCMRAGTFFMSKRRYSGLVLGLSRFCVHFYVQRKTRFYMITWVFSCKINLGSHAKTLQIFCSVPFHKDPQRFFCTFGVFDFPHNFHHTFLIIQHMCMIWVSVQWAEHVLFTHIQIYVEMKVGATSFSFFVPPPPNFHRKSRFLHFVVLSTFYAQRKTYFHMITCVFSCKINLGSCAKS